MCVTNHFTQLTTYLLSKYECVYDEFICVKGNHISNHFKPLIAFVKKKTINGHMTTMKTVTANKGKIAQPFHCRVVSENAYTLI